MFCDPVSRSRGQGATYRACFGYQGQSIDCAMTQMLPSPDQPLKIGTRGSPLALAQAVETRARLMAATTRIVAEHGVEACFANPGTSEMQLVAALDKQPSIRAVLCLFEGVVTGAADGYGRMADKPALTLLHLGPGFANGIANLHNAQRARSPILNMVNNYSRTLYKRSVKPKPIGRWGTSLKNKWL